MTLYLDASVIVPLFVDEPMTALVEAWLAAQDDPVIVGRLAIGETASAISRRHRQGELNDDERLEALATSDEWFASAVTVIEQQSSDIAEAALWVRRPSPKLLMPDAIHLTTCRRMDVTFITCDKPLATVAAVRRVRCILLD